LLLKQRGLSLLAAVARQLCVSSRSIRHTSSCLCVIFPRSPQSLIGVSAWGLINLIPEVQPAAQRKRGSNRFPTDLSLHCRFPATRII
ncbi:MAG: hypothetical protein N6V49_08535, partial [Serratia symbiotica]|nr:hypothetical protein [Serratia symbiotica]